MTEIIEAKCKCGGSISYYAGAYQCTECGTEWTTNQEKHKFYEEHKTEILADVKKHGQTGARKLWRIPVSSLSQLLKKWPQEGPPAPDKPAAPDPPHEPKQVFVITDQDLHQLNPSQQEVVYRAIGHISAARVKHLIKEN